MIPARRVLRLAWAPLVFLVAWGGFATAASAQDGSATAEVEALLGATPEDQRAYAAQAVSDVESVASKLKGYVAGITAEDSEADAGCVRVTSVYANTLLDVATQAKASLDAALGQGAAAESKIGYELRKLAIAKEQASRLLAEGERCAIGSTSQEGSTEVGVTGRGAGLADILADVGSSILDWGFDPPDASPF